ncbi:peptidoglycan-associated lipoprotein Pal [Silvanigrella aquatica]|uniref:Peptidoglycan-associated lipoprotein n=1 Tax=Silvanigrella aquatica TaxID=1915309 RepID=A0A1L4CYG9_9BACT|nr:peptidoglycan-associated lipoprotein Pal [Silvanigrella aquatica]APJ02996.1 peptidoglycan-associated lipoprotein [Silvanigrella aquatica]
MNFSKVILSTSILTLAFLAASCSSTKKPGSSEPSKPVEVSSEPAAKVTTQNPGSSGSLNTIYFDFNKYDIRENQKEAADQIAESLKSNSSLAIQIQGNTDDRGSTEYNMALGQKRAVALKNYLMANGVKNKIETISYGKERPAVQGNNEEAWSKNRRDDIVKMK